METKLKLQWYHFIQIWFRHFTMGTRYYTLRVNIEDLDSPKPMFDGKIGPQAEIYGADH